MKVFSRIIFLINLCLWQICTYGQIDSSLYKILQQLPEDTILKISTYDASGQLMHPDIVYLNNANYKGLFMVATPYPFYNDKLENPCIYVSDNGMNFFEPIEGINPLVKAPYIDHNDDPDITFDSINNVFRILYLETLRPKEQNLIELTGYPGGVWLKSIKIKYKLKRGEKFIVSPSNVQISEKEKALFYVVNDYDGNKNNRVEYLKSKNNKWNKKKFFVPKVKLPDGFTPWHIDVVKENNRFYMILDGFWGAEMVWGDTTVSKYTVLLGVSENYNSWDFSSVNLVDCSNIPVANCHYIYRSTALISGDLLAVWYSYVTMKGEWNIGVKKVRLM